MTISVLVSVYNREGYLRRCVDSVLAQKNVDTEIILVDDGSTDSSGQICDEYADRYDNVIAIHQKNQGISVARNVALDRAKGEFISFLDSDDFLPEDALHTLMSLQMEHDADCVMGNYAHYTDDGIFDKVIHLPEKYANKVLSNREACEILLFSAETHVLMVNWGKIYKRQMWDGLRFPATITKSEDQYIFPVLMERAKTFYYTDRIVYNQVFSSKSISRNTYTRVFLFHSEGVLILIDYLLEKGYYDIALHKFGEGTRHLFDFRNVLFDDESREEIKRQLKAYKEIAKKLIPYVCLKEKLRLGLFIINKEAYNVVRKTLRG